MLEHINAELVPLVMRHTLEDMQQYDNEHYTDLQSMAVRIQTSWRKQRANQVAEHARMAMSMLTPKQQVGLRSTRL